MAGLAAAGPGAAAAGLAAGLAAAGPGAAAGLAAGFFGSMAGPGAAAAGFLAAGLAGIGAGAATQGTRPLNLSYCSRTSYCSRSSCVPTCRPSSVTVVKSGPVVRHRQLLRTMQEEQGHTGSLEELAGLERIPSVALPLTLGTCRHRRIRGLPHVG